MICHAIYTVHRPSHRLIDNFLAIEKMFCPNDGDRIVLPQELNKFENLFIFELLFRWLKLTKAHKFQFHFALELTELTLIG